jgi:DNA-binding NarL/FixJ family response regulator
MVQDEAEEGIPTPGMRNSPSPNLPSTSADVHVRNGSERGSGGDRRSQATSYWIPNENAVISIGVIDEHSFTRECITISLQELDRSLDISSFAACEDCLGSAKKYDLILYHAHGNVPHQDNCKERVIAFDKALHVAPVIILSAVDCPESIFQALESGARGYIPTTDTTLALAMEIIRLVRAGGTFVPPSTLSLRRINPQGLTPKPITTQQFTPRQIAVLDHLKLGKANKIIAHELQMSESTVKIHLRNIMKKMNATNRTEVACRAHILATTAVSVMSQES